MGGAREIKGHATLSRIFKAKNNSIILQLGEIMEYKDFAIDLAKRAGEIMRQNFKLGMSVEYKSDKSIVTEADIAINKMVIDKVKEEFPGHDILGEEESDIQANSEYLWVCDPIDGTSPFSHGVPTCAFSLALVKNGESIVGVCYDPFLDRMVFAEKNKGATLNNIDISVSNTQKPQENGLIDICSFIRARYQLWPLYETFAKLGVRTSKLGSIVYPGMLVACGEATAAIFPHTGCHDIAALKIIVEEAGGKVTDLFGNEQRYDQAIKGAIVSNGKIHDLLVKEVGKVLKNED